MFFIDDATTCIHTGSTNGSDLLLVEMMRESAQKVCIARRAWLSDPQAGRVCNCPRALQPAHTLASTSDPLVASRKVATRRTCETVNLHSPASLSSLHLHPFIIITCRRLGVSTGLFGQMKDPAEWYSPPLLASSSAFNMHVSTRQAVDRVCNPKVVPNTQPCDYL